MAKVKDIFNTVFLTELSTKLQTYYPNFDHDKFQTFVFQNDWDSLEFKQRVHRITTSMHRTLSFTYKETLSLLYKCAPEFEGLQGIIFPEYVAKYGQENWDESMEALAYFTRYSTSEFAVRPFLQADLEKMLTQMFTWSEHPNEHIRRLASEGSRPRLPWGNTVLALKNDPSQLLPILENLKADESLYVRRSVANNLNDISRTHPDMMIERMKEWHGKNEKSDWIIQHASRTLLKQAHPEVLALFGYQSADLIKVGQFNIASNQVAIGGDLTFYFEVFSKTTTNLRVEYAIDYVKKSGKRNKKIFKITSTKIEENERKTYSRKQSFRNMTTRTHYTGVHVLSIIVNGIKKASCEFEVINLEKE
ncbi:hypothetical protein GCM10011351_11980 [Paraliobacillus quinghaiensis]|uniref:DNA alkylation repair protein n=1 Tax=Paraliobacillus quinghaiensis TaxID=470815 RepID=A0A917WTY2_9BACI|nr:DNA alkylation repair protein [Paraliobacillus quinghaiensis]GGM27712.1 hypothetical protein GCM10011351_11980 [Paraliobacillus quinghaiensis]